MPSSGPDDGHAWLQVGAAALKQCVASGCIPEATLPFRAAQTRDQPTGKPPRVFRVEEGRGCVSGRDQQRQRFVIDLA